MMLWTIIRKEIVSHILSLRFGVTFILFILLIFASIYVTANKYERDKAQYSAYQRVARDQLDEILREEEEWRRTGRLFDWQGRLDGVEVPALSSIAQGLTPFTPVAINTTANSSESIGQAWERNPLAGLLRVPDIVYVVSVVLSLLAILFAFDSICGEKESGTLRLILSNAVPRDSILFGKWIGGYVMLVIPFLIATVGGFGYAWWRGVLELNAENLHRLGVLLLVGCLYVSVFFTLSIFVSSTTHRAATSLLICLLIWTVWILIIPNLAPVIAKIILPAPSIEKINGQKRAVDKEIQLRVERLSLISGELFYGKKMIHEREKLFQEAKHRKRQWDRLLARDIKRQRDLSLTLGRLSPSVCWTYSALALTDTGADAYQRFEEAQNRLLKDMGKLQTDLRRNYDNTRKRRKLVAEAVPQLQVVRAHTGSVTRNALTDILIMAILNVVFFMAAFVLFLRYDVR